KVPKKDRAVRFIFFKSNSPDDKTAEHWYFDLDSNLDTQAKYLRDFMSFPMSMNTRQFSWKIFHKDFHS
ncbi:hypothetical protein X975_20776, partial [Stegodyphus mimosarum]